MAGNFEEIQQRFVQMLEDGRHIFDASANALVGGTDPEAIRADLFATDRRINETEQELRRLIVVHGSVHGAPSFPALLVTMSVAKDAERIGDYAKNFYDLVKYGADFEDAPDHELLADYRDRVSNLLSDAAETFQNRDEERARALIAQADSFLDEYDAQVKAASQSTGPASDAVARALYFRFLKRITAHVMNFLTSLVLPVDRLDYYDETKDDRA